MNMKPLLFTMTLLFSVSGQSFFFETDEEKVMKILEKQSKAIALGDVYSICKFNREMNEIIYESKSEKLKELTSTLRRYNETTNGLCKGY